MKWTETKIASALAMQHFQRRYLCLVPNCNWTGHECDLLAVTENMRIIDVEIKISRSDLKADAKKEKWWNRPYNWPFTVGSRVHGPPAPDVRLLHPMKVWKHYYVMPAEIWKDELFENLGSPDSGVLLLFGDSKAFRFQVIRRAKPSKNADHLSSAQVIDIARLASLRMWDSYKKLEDARSIL